MKTYQELLRAAKVVAELEMLNDPEMSLGDNTEEQIAQARYKLGIAIEAAEKDLQMLSKARAMVIGLPEDIRETAMVAHLIKEHNPDVVIISNQNFKTIPHVRTRSDKGKA